MQTVGLALIYFSIIEIILALITLIGKLSNKTVGDGNLKIIYNA